MKISDIFSRKSSKSSKKPTIKLNFSGNFAGESKEMKKYRMDISTDFQNLLNKIDDVRRDDSLSVDEKYGIMMGSLYMVNKITGEMIDGGIFFSNDKQFEKVHQKVKEEMNNNKVPNYIG